MLPVSLAQRIDQLAGPGMLVVTRPEEMVVETGINGESQVVSAEKPIAPDA